MPVDRALGLRPRTWAEKREEKNSQQWLTNRHLWASSGCTDFILGAVVQLATDTQGDKYVYIFIYVHARTRARTHAGTHARTHIISASASSSRTHSTTRSTRAETALNQKDHNTSNSHDNTANDGHEGDGTVQ